MPEIIRSRAACCGLAVDDLDLDAFAEIEAVGRLARSDPTMLDTIDGQQVDGVACADIVVTRLEFSRDLLDEDTGVVDLDRLTVIQTTKHSVTGVLAGIGVEPHDAPITRSGCEVANPALGVSLTSTHTL